MCLGVPAKVVELMDNFMAKVDVNGNEVEVGIILTPEVKVGDYVMVHAGFAMQILEKDVADETMELMLELQKIRESYYGQ
jgi:hydrogenase expression/formation protein HypC